VIIVTSYPAVLITHFHCDLIILTIYPIFAFYYLVTLITVAVYWWPIHRYLLPWPVLLVYLLFGCISTLLLLHLFSYYLLCERHLPYLVGCCCCSLFYAVIPHCWYLRYCSNPLLPYLFIVGIVIVCTTALTLTLLIVVMDIGCYCVFSTYLLCANGITLHWVCHWLSVVLHIVEPYYLWSIINSHY